MGKITIAASGGNNTGSDECTATRAEVLKGYSAITKDSDDEVIEGVLELKGTAADSQVLSGQTFYNTDVKTKRIGAMANRGAVSQTLNAGGSYTIQAGYHNGAGKVTANSLSGQTSGNAAPGQILDGQIAWVNGNKVIGTMANQGAKTSTLNCGGSYAIPAGYHNGSGKITANNLASQTGGATADDSKVLTGYTYWKDGTKRTGNLTVSSAVSFSVAQYSNMTLIASWAKPFKGPWSGVRIMCKQGNYPASVSDGTLFYEGLGPSATKTLAVGSWYFRAWNYMTTSVGRIYGGYFQANVNNQPIRGQQVFTSSGIFVVPENVRSIDIFCVGAGGGGGLGSKNSSYKFGGGGGGGGYTATRKDCSVTPGQQIAITVGAGSISNGGNTMAGTFLTASGGVRGGWEKLSVAGDGGSGGSGGGGGSAFYTREKFTDAYNGGSDGSDAKLNGNTTWYPGVGSTGTPGIGQHTTTRAFGESGGTLYAGGGGGGDYFYTGHGGAGGGGETAASGSAGTGGGGGGDFYGYGGYTSGGSGIAIIRWGY